MAKRFHTYLIDEAVNERYDIEIHDDQFSGSSTFFYSDGEGFAIRYTGEGGAERTAPFLATECTVTMYVQNATHEGLITDLLAAPEGRFSVKITKGVIPSLFWVGMVLPDIGTYDEAYYPYNFTIRATDGLAVLKDIKYNNAGTAYTGKARVIEHICFCLTKIYYVNTHFSGSDVLVRSAVDWWEETMTNTAVVSDALYNAYIDHAVFYKYDRGQDYLSCLDVLKNILITFGARITQIDGKFWIEQITYRNSATIVLRNYDKTGAFLSTVNFSGNNTINQTNTGALLAVGKYEFFPALSEARHTFKINNRRNFLANSAPINQASSAQVISVPISYNDGNTTLRLTGSFVVRISSKFPNPAYTATFKPFAMVMEINLTIGDKQLKRDYTITPDFQIKYSAPTWVAAGGSSGYYILVPLTGQFLTNTTTATYTFTQAFDVSTSELLESGSSITFSMALEELKRYDGGTYAQSNFNIAYEFVSPWLEAYSYGSPALTDDEVEYKTVNTELTSNTAVHESESIIGTDDDPNSVGALWVKPGADYQLGLVWGDGTDTPANRIEELLTQFIVSGQHKPTRKINGVLFGNILAMQRVYWQGVYWLLLSGTWSAQNNQFDGEWVEIDYLPGLSASPPRRLRFTGNNFTTPPAPTKTNDGNSLIDQNGTPPATLAGAIAETTTSEYVRAGAVTYLPVPVTLGSGDYISGEEVTIVNPFSGTSETVTISTTSSAGDTQIGVTGTLTQDYPEGSFLIKKPPVGDARPTAWAIYRGTVNSSREIVLAAGQLPASDKDIFVTVEGIVYDTTMGSPTYTVNRTTNKITFSNANLNGLSYVVRIANGYSRFTDYRGFVSGTDITLSSGQLPGSDTNLFVMVEGITYDSFAGSPTYTVNRTTNKIVFSNTLLNGFRYLVKVWQ